MTKVLIIGAGGGGQVVTHKCAQVPEVFSEQMLTGQWREDGVFNMEQFDPDPFMADLTRYGLPWRVRTLDEPLD